MAITKTKKIFTSSQLGVTLIELIVVISIFAVISSVLLFNYSDFSTNVSIRNLSQEVALTIRKAQTYATSVHGIANSVGNRVYPAYGIAFSLESSGGPYSPNPKQFVLFADLVAQGDTYPNKKYDSTGSCGLVEQGNECIEAVNITTSDSLVGIQTDNGPVTSGSVTVTFRRPNPDAFICYIPQNQTDCDSTTSHVKLKFRSAKGLERTVSVWNTGQINVE